MKSKKIDNATVNAPLLIGMIVIVCGIIVTGAKTSKMPGLLLICSGLVCVCLYCVCNLLQSIAERLK